MNIYDINFCEANFDEIVEKIRILVGEKVDLENNLTLNRTSKRDVADEKLRELLVRLFNTIGVDNNFENIERSFLYSVLANNTLFINQLPNMLLLYYAAVNFDNTELLRRIIKEKICLGTSYDDLMLCVLDNKISSFFDEDEYLELLKTHKGYFEPFYESIKDLPDFQKIEYSEKFSRILKGKTIPWAEKCSDALCKNRLDVFDEETYKKVSREQFYNVILQEPTEWEIRYDDYIIAIYNAAKEWRREHSRWVKREENRQRLNRLLRETNYCHWVYFVDGDFIFDSFTDEELVNMSSRDCFYFWNAIRHGTFERVINLYRHSKKIAAYEVTCFPEFLEMYTDEEILLLNDNSLRLINENKITYFRQYPLWSIDDCVLYNKVATNKIKKIVNKNIKNSRRQLEDKKIKS